MASTIENGRTCLELRGYDERHVEITRSDYNIEDQYGATHPDALSNGDPQGKGANHGGHTDFLPDCTKPTTTIDYSNFATVSTPDHTIGGLYDIEGRAGIPGRDGQTAKSLYNINTQYGLSLINTEENIRDGQWAVGMTMDQK